MKLSLSDAPWLALAAVMYAAACCSPAYAACPKNVRTRNIAVTPTWIVSKCESIARPGKWIADACCADAAIDEAARRPPPVAPPVEQMNAGRAQGEEQPQESGKQ